MKSLSSTSYSSAYLDREIKNNSPSRGHGRPTGAFPIAYKGQPTLNGHKSPEHFKGTTAAKPCFNLDILLRRLMASSRVSSISPYRSRSKVKLSNQWVLTN